MRERYTIPFIAPQNVVIAPIGHFQGLDESMLQNQKESLHPSSAGEAQGDHRTIIPVILASSLQ